MAKSGDTIRLRTGIYRESIDIKTTGAKPLTIEAMPGEKPQIFGSVRISSWRWGHSSGSWDYTPDILSPAMAQLPAGTTSDSGHLFVDDQPAILRTDCPPKEPGYALQPDRLHPEVVPVSIFQRFAPGDDAGKHNFEWATAHSIIVGETGACPVHLKDLDIAYANNGRQEGVVVLCSPGSVVEKCVVRDSISRGISICPQGTVTHCHVYGHGILGIGSAGGDSHGVPGMKVIGCEIDHNAWNNPDTGWEAGGVKLSSAHQAVVERNDIHDNGAWGVWFDWQCVGDRIENNRCRRNVAGGIFLEASRGSNFIDNNICTDTRRDAHNDWGDGIYSHNSSDAGVFHNLCLNNACYGIRFRLTTDQRLDDGTLVECSRNWITYNICAGNGVAQVSLPSNAPRMQANMSDENMLFANGPGAGTARDGVHPDAPLLDLAAWQKLGFDRHSVAAQPVFRDAEHGDYRPGPNAPQTKLGPKPVGPIDAAP